MSYSLYYGDCLEEMRNIPDKSVDLILCDLPYGFTDCKWDKIIPFEPLWKEYKKVLKIRGIVVLFGNQPFTSSIINSNLSDYSHMWYWKKNYTTGSLLAKQQPLRCIEDIVVFKCNDVYNNNADMHKGLRNYSVSSIKQTFHNTFFNRNYLATPKNLCYTCPKVYHCTCLKREEGKRWQNYYMEVPAAGRLV